MQQMQQEVLHMTYSLSCASCYCLDSPVCEIKVNVFEAVFGMRKQMSNPCYLQLLINYK